MPNLFDNTDAPAKPARAPYVPQFNPDGVSVKGCTAIYAPKGQAGEYSALAVNLYRGCGHKCAYCYVPQVIKMERPEFDAGAVLRPGILDKLKSDAARYRQLGSRTQIMFSFTTDPFHPFDCTATRTALEVLRAHELPFCTLTKGGARALRDAGLFRPECDAFASTLTTLDDKFSKKWERGAALPADRLDTLRAFHERDVFTWVSLEPTLDIEASLAIVEATHTFVDLYKVGQANYLKEITRTTDWHGYTLRMLNTLNGLGVAHYIKKDLQKFLPVDYPNPLRIPQNNAPASRVHRALLVEQQRAAWLALGEHRERFRRVEFAAMEGKPQ